MPRRTDMESVTSDDTAGGFPPVASASREGLVAVGGDLQAARLLAAYSAGIFPWYSVGQPILWWSPDPRSVLYLDRLRITRSLKKTLRRGTFRVTLDTCFRDVIQACAEGRHRRGATGTWITPAMRRAYIALHEQGYAHSVEAWHGDVLAGGLYGVSLGRAFFGESMFSHETDASKVALVYLVRQLQLWGFDFIDAQVSSSHMTSLGAIDVPRAQFIKELKQALAAETRVGRWTPDTGLETGLLAT
jgi:leucyl/phenylalanyl-tRNA--protein transferase